MQTPKRAAIVSFFLLVALAGSPVLTQKPAAMPAPAARAQVDGIVDRVLDRLWDATDHYWHDGDYHRVIALCRVIVEADPAFYEAWGVASWLLWSLGDTATADAFLQEGVRRNPNVYHLHYDLAWHLFNTKRYAEALPHFQKAVQFPDAPAQVWKQLGHTYDRLDRLDEAVAVWKTVTEKFPDDPTGPTNLRRVTEKRDAQARPPAR